MLEGHDAVAIGSSVKEYKRVVASQSPVTLHTVRAVFLVIFYKKKTVLFVFFLPYFTQAPRHSPYT